MKLWENIQRRFVVATAASQVMQGIIQRQMDLQTDLPDDVMRRKGRQSAKIAAGFAWALWQELSANKQW